MMKLNESDSNCCGLSCSSFDYAQDDSKSPQRLLDRRKFIKTASAAAGAAMLPSIQSCGFPHIKKKKKPNILFIITDQQHYDTISGLGCKHARTDTMDHLVKNGVYFNQAYCTNPVCSPSRSSMFTGRMPSETGVFINKQHIRKTIPTMGEWFNQKGGYETVYAGKWHLPDCYTPDIRGFNVISSGIGHQGTISDPLVTSACTAFLHNHNKSTPFLMVASYMQPHDICEWLRFNKFNRDTLLYPEIKEDLPELPENFNAVVKEPELIAKIRRRGEPATGKWKKLHWQYYLWSYFRHIEMVDGEISRLINTLEMTGRIENTVIVFVSDHGEGLGHHQMVRKKTPYDESARVPLLVSYPHDLPKGRIVKDRLASGLDIMPTLCDLSGIPMCKDAKGISLKSVLQEKADKSQREFVALECDANRGQVIRTGQYKYIAYKDDPVEMLFDMKNDPGETKNLAFNPNYSSELKAHRKLLKEWINQLDVAPNLPKEARWFST